MGGEILLVEDDEDIRQHLALILERKGYRVASAADGRQALDYLRNAAPPPCVILLDLMMPVMSGWEFREAQRADPRLVSIPVIVLTGHGLATAEERALDVAGYLIKPFALDDLLFAVERHCPPRGA
jgi:CheY-like chemotaxis protein